MKPYKTVVIGDYRSINTYIIIKIVVDDSPITPASAGDLGASLGGGVVRPGVVGGGVVRGGVVMGAVDAGALVLGR